MKNKKNLANNSDKGFSTFIKDVQDYNIPIFMCCTSCSHPFSICVAIMAGSLMITSYLRWFQSSVCPIEHPVGTLLVLQIIKILVIEVCKPG